MITLISGTNRPNNNTRKVVSILERLYREKGVETQVLDLCTLPRDVAFSEVYGNRSDAFAEILVKYVASVDKFVFVVPEYNGGFPGIVKLFLDAAEPKMWYGKKAAIAGLSAGRSGNLRGMDHLTGVLNYLQVNVHHFKPGLSRLYAEDKGDLVLSADYDVLLNRHVELFADF